MTGARADGAAVAAALRALSALVLSPALLAPALGLAQLRTQVDLPGNVKSAS